MEFNKNNNLYDDKNLDSIVEYSKKIINKTFLEILMDQKFDKELEFEYIKEYSNPRRKGSLGNFLEKIYFGYKINNKSKPDFEKVGVELKVSPCEIKKNKELRVGERLSITMISYDKITNFNFFESHLWAKMNKILLIYYFRDEKIDNKLNFKIKYAGIFSPSEEDLQIIKNDYNLIISKIEKGLAHELSESDTMYLASTTKGPNAEKSLRSQYYNKNQKAKSRCFSLKNSYMNTILNNFVNNSNQLESLIHDSKQLEKTNFEEYILNRLKKYFGKKDKELNNILEIINNNSKNKWSKLSYGMLGIKSNSAVEFVKSNIIVKTIRVEKNNTIKEHISFPHFEFKELVKETWESSSIYKYFDETKFLFFIFKKVGDGYIFSCAKFWNIPKYDLENDVRNCWRNTKNIITNGIKFMKKGDTIFNNLPSSKDNKILHVRPHASKRAYRLKDGTTIGNIKDANELPNGEWMTKQSFWINNKYILKKIV